MQTSTPSINEIVQRTRDLLDEKQAAEVLTVEPGTLSVWRSTGRYKIPFVKVGLCHAFDGIYRSFFDSGFRSYGLITLSRSLSRQP